MCGNPDHHEGRRKRNKARTIQLNYFITFSSSSHFWRKESFIQSSLMAEWWQWSTTMVKKKWDSWRMPGSSHCCYLVLLLLSFCPLRHQFASSNLHSFHPIPNPPWWWTERALGVLISWCTICPGGQSLVVVPPGRHLRSQ